VPDPSQASENLTVGTDSAETWRVRYVLPLALPIIAAAFTDLPRLWRLGDWTALGILAVAQAIMFVLVLLTSRDFPRRLGSLLWPIPVLAAWLAIGSIWWPGNGDRLPNVLGYLLLGGSIAVGAVTAAQDRAQATKSIAAGMSVLDVLGLGLVAVSFASFGYRIHSWPMHPRAVALVALVPVCWHLARWSSGNWWAAIRATLWIAAIIITLSRMATAAALAAVILALVLRVGTRRSRTLRHAVPFLTLLAAGLLAVAIIEPFRERLFKQDRTPIWERVASSALEAPVRGKGPGSSQAYPVLRYWWTTEAAGPLGQRQGFDVREYWTPHPHNEYLRIWHDLGAIGLSIVLLAFVSWARALHRASRRTAVTDSADAPDLETAGLLMLATLMIVMLTDNPLVYPFVIVPVGILIGAGLGAAACRNSTNDREPA
jgi:O-antigen ligase